MTQSKAEIEKVVSVGGAEWQSPFVHVFDVRGDKYAYDVNTNEILEITDALAALLTTPTPTNESELRKQLTERFGEEQCSEAISDFCAARKAGLFSVQRPLVYDPYCDRDTTEWVTRHGVKMITLILTDDCNLRCKYCPSVIYGSGQWKSTGKHMTLATARRAVDFLLSHSSEVRAPAGVTFYGGEPLLNRKVIEGTIEYAMKAAWPRQLMFSMTTNGTLLSEDFVKWLAERDVPIDISVSLDGPAGIHDANRVTARGEGSFDVVYDNVRRIYSKFPAWFEEHIGFFSTMAPPYSLSERRDFFGSCEFPCAGRVRPGAVSAQDLSQYRSLDSVRVEAPRVRREVFELLVESLVDNRYRWTRDELWYADSVVEFLRNIHLRPRHKLAGRVPRGWAMCFLGTDRMAVTADGKFSVCAQLFGFGGGDLIVGSLQEGYHIERIMELREESFAFFAERCSSCWVMRLCRGCILHRRARGDLIGNADKECDREREYTEKMLALYCRIHKSNPVAFDQV